MKHEAYKRITGIVLFQDIAYAEMYIKIIKGKKYFGYYGDGEQPGPLIWFSKMRLCQELDTSLFQKFSQWEKGINSKGRWSQCSSVLAEIDESSFGEHPITEVPNMETVSKDVETLD